MSLGHVSISYDECTCPWCEEETLEVTLENADSDGELVLTLNCPACEEYVDKTYRFDVDVEEYAEAWGWLLSEIDDTETNTDLYEDEELFDEIEIFGLDWTFGVKYTIFCDQDGGSILDVEIYECDANVLNNVADAVVKREEMRYLDPYVSYLHSHDQPIEALLECLQKACETHQKTDLFYALETYVKSL